MKSTFVQYMQLNMKTLQNVKKGFMIAGYVIKNIIELSLKKIV